MEYLKGDHAKNKDNQDYWLEKVAGKKVAIFDFSFERPLLEKMHATAQSLLVLDHHVTARDKLADLPYCYFDMRKSGAMLAWEACHEEEAPDLIKYVQDQDLWQWRLKDSQEICCYINSFEFSFPHWDTLYGTLKNEPRSAAVAGRAMLRKQDMLTKAIARDAEEWNILGYTIPASNCPSVLRSAVCEKIGQRHKAPFAGAYAIESGKVTWSLRSNHGTVDVGKVAKSFPGGGGHPKAAGFTVPLEAVDFKKRKVKWTLAQRVDRLLTTLKNYF